MFLNVYKKINHFLFENKVQTQLGLTRLFLTGTLLFLALSRQLNMDQYGLDAIISRSEALNIYPEFYRPAFQYFFWSDQWASVIHFGLIILLLIAFLGLSNRFLMLITWVIAQGFINRNYSMLFGADLIGTLFLFYLSFTDCHTCFTVKSIFRKYFLKNHIENKSNQKNKSIFLTEFKSEISSVFFRLMQFQLAVIYAYTGFEKFKGSTWWDGTALWTVFANPQFSQFDFIYLRNFPLFFSIGTFITLIFEVYFPAMMMFKPGRYIWLSLGLFFHLNIGILLGLMPFSMVMLAPYFLFLDQSHINLFSKYCLNMIHKISKNKSISESV